MTFGEKIQLLRKQKGLSQEQLADAVMVSRQAVSKWELDCSLPDTTKVIQLSRLFGVSTDYLLMDEAPGNVPGTTVRAEGKTHNAMQKIVGAICAAIGGLGLLTMFVLSTMIQVPVTKKKILPDGSVDYYGGGDVLGYSFIGFLEQYRLQVLLITLTLLLITGVALIFMKKSE